MPKEKEVPKDKVGNAINFQWVFPRNKVTYKSVHRSAVFRCHRIKNVSYYLKFFPNQNGNAVISFKFINEDKDEIEVNLDFSVKSVNFEKKLESRHERSFIQKLGKTKPIRNEIILCSTKEFFDETQHYFNEHNEFIISVVGALYSFESRRPLICEWRFKSGRRSRQIFFNSDRTKDIKIIAQNGIVEAHKWVLATRSKFFNDAYNSDEQLEVTEFEMKEFDLETVGMAITLCYDQDLIKEEITFNQKLHLLLLFDRYPIQHYKAELEEHLSSIVDETNVCLIAHAAWLAHSSSLAKRCEKYIKVCAQANVPLLNLEDIDEKFRIKICKGLFMHETQTL